MRIIAGILIWLALTVPAEANVLDWPVISHAVKIGSCVVADAGKIGQSALTHGTMFLGDVARIVADCASFIVETITPNLVPDPHVTPEDS